MKLIFKIIGRRKNTPKNKRVIAVTHQLDNGQKSHFDSVFSPHNKTDSEVISEIGSRVFIGLFEQKRQN